MADKKAKRLDCENLTHTHLPSRMKLVFTEGLQGKTDRPVYRLRFAHRISQVLSFSGVISEKSGLISHVNFSRGKGDVLAIETSLISDKK